MNLRRTQSLIRILLLSLTLNGCYGLYRQDIQQGNLMTEMQITQLRQGMTPREVKKLLGTPVLVQTALDELDIDEKTPLLSSTSEKLLDNEEKDLMRMEYVYFYQPGHGKSIQKRISLVFEDEKLMEFKMLT
jgi:hypothetical protein